MDELHDWFDCDDGYKVDHVWESQAMSRYNNNKTKKVNDKMVCACCNKNMIKKSYQSQFCSNKGKGNCKDMFWNRVDRKRFEKAIQFNGYHTH